MTYTQVATRDCHTVLLKSDGVAVACGDNSDRMCVVLAPEESATYMRSAVGDCHEALPKDGVDGTVELEDDMHDAPLEGCSHGHGGAPVADRGRGNLIVDETEGNEYDLSGMLAKQRAEESSPGDLGQAPIAVCIRWS